MNDLKGLSRLSGLSTSLLHYYCIYRLGLLHTLDALDRYLQIQAAHLWIEVGMLGF